MHELSHPDQRISYSSRRKVYTHKEKLTTITNYVQAQCAGIWYCIYFTDNGHNEMDIILLLYLITTNRQKARHAAHRLFDYRP